ncbi:hypothetical protein MKW98_023249 [Papaver atlanticum]|uniref:Uncharacterized protein n=1 Tax=Papaver atlanticum TaxID=357466 RepID=A0AAD4XVB7_9MAGN|nr:hypothetical protein MKW98_023249 [Papaver atlanticum]
MDFVEKGIGSSSLQDSGWRRLMKSWVKFFQVLIEGNYRLIEVPTIASSDAKNKNVEHVVILCIVPNLKNIRGFWIHATYFQWRRSGKHRDRM